MPPARRWPDRPLGSTPGLAGSNQGGSAGTALVLLLPTSTRLIPPLRGETVDRDLECSTSFSLTVTAGISVFLTIAVFLPAADGS